MLERAAWLRSQSRLGSYAFNPAWYSESVVEPSTGEADDMNDRTETYLCNNNYNKFIEQGAGQKSGLQ